MLGQYIPLLLSSVPTTPSKIWSPAPRECLRSLCKLAGGFWIHRWAKSGDKGPRTGKQGLERGTQILAGTIHHLTGFIQLPLHGAQTLSPGPAWPARHRTRVSFPRRVSAFLQSASLWQGARAASTGSPPHTSMFCAVSQTLWLCCIKAGLSDKLNHAGVLIDALMSYHSQGAVLRFSSGFLTRTPMAEFSGLWADLGSQQRSAFIQLVPIDLYWY